MRKEKKFEKVTQLPIRDMQRLMRAYDIIYEVLEDKNISGELDIEFIESARLWLSMYYEIRRRRNNE